MALLLNRGNLYKIYNSNLLYHGCVPLNEDGSFKEVDIFRKTYKGKALYDVLDTYIRKASLHWNRKSERKAWIFCGISGAIRTHRCLVKIRWQLLSDTLWLIGAA